MINFEKTVEEINQRGFWVVSFFPEKKSKPSQELKNVLRDNIVSIRGWDYPHLPEPNKDYQKLYSTNKGIEGFTNWENHIEVLRLLESKQFISSFALREDWLERNSWAGGNDPKEQEDYPRSVLDVVGSVYSITEFFIFLKNLVDYSFYSVNVNIKIELHNTKGKKLTYSDWNRKPFLKEYICERENQISVIDKKYNLEEFKTDYLKLAMEGIINLFRLFDWDNMPVEAFQKDQENFINKNF